MSFSDWMALGQLIIGAVSVAVAITGGVLAILGYKKIIKSTDDNAKERQAAIEASAKRVEIHLQENAQVYMRMVKRDRLMLGSLAALVAIFIFLSRMSSKQKYAT